MSSEDEDLWQALLRGGEEVATEADYEHGYAREVRANLSRYVTFRIGTELYGLPIHQIVEITKMIETTPVPRTASYLLGIGNVRGTVIPVLDLARRLWMPPIQVARATRVLIVNLEDELQGLVVDEVIEVLSLSPDELEEAPGGIGATRAEFIKALGRRAGRIVIILDLTTVLDARDLVLPQYRAQQRRGAQ